MNENVHVLPSLLLSIRYFDEFRITRDVAALRNSKGRKQKSS